MKATPRIAFFLLLAAWALLPGATTKLRSQERPPDNAVSSQIEDGVEKARAGKLLDAIEQFQKVLDTSGDELVPVDRAHYAPARLVVHGHLARLGSEGVKIYRQRLDGQAAQRFAEVKKQRDDTPLQHLVVNMFAASATENAILELAQRAFLRGDFDAAEHYWRMLLPMTEGDVRVLVFPMPKSDPALIRARLLVLQLFRGEREEVREAFKEFQKMHGEATGTLAGRKGKYLDTLMYLLEHPNETTLAPLPARPGWPTFAGSPARLGNARMPLPYFWPDTPSWKSTLPFVKHEQNDGLPPDGRHPRSLAFHPVITDGRAYVADGTRVLAIDLSTGVLSGVAWPKGGKDTRIPTEHDIRHTLTEHEGILYGRFGPAALKSAEGENGKSFIVAFGQRKGDTEQRESLWRLDPPSLADATTHFEGAPVVYNDQLYVGLWRQGAGDPVAGVACYRLDELKTRPALAWQKWVGKAGTEPNEETRYRHALVTISNPNVIYCTDGGAVVALNAMSGKTAWEYRYPRNERPIMPRYRALCPPLADGGRIYAAPADTDRLLCIDAFTGRLIWERDGIEVVHLLGVARGRLIATIAGQVKGIRGFNLRTGADSGNKGWTIHDDGGEATFGRGLVTEDAVVWPTKHALHFLSPADGSPLRSPIRGSFGNLCYADGVLLVTTATEVWGFVTEAKKLGVRRKAIEKKPDDPKLRADLTQSLIDAGQYAEAENVASQSGEAKDRLLWLLAERLIREGNTDEAKRIYEGLAKGDGSFAAAGAVRLAEMETDPTKRREAWLPVFKRKATIRDHRGIPWRASTYAINRFGELIEMRGIGVRDDDHEGVIGSPGRAVQSSPLPLTRTSERVDVDSSRKILNTSPAGIVASGERLVVFPEGIAIELPFVPVVADRRGDILIVADSWNIQKLAIAGKPTFWELRYRPNDPIVSSLANASIPAASGLDGPVDLAPIRLDSGEVTFQYDDRFQVTIPGVEILQGVEKLRPENPDRTTMVQLTEGRSLQVTHRDHGIELDQRDGNERSWAREPIFVGPYLDDLASIGERFFTASDSMLTAYGWKNGERQWEIPLPDQRDTTWKITPSPQGLLVHPTEALMTRTDFDAVGEFRKAGWRWDKLLQAVGKSYDVWTDRELPILVIDPTDGRLTQRLNFPAAGPAAGVTVTRKGVVVVTGKGCWTLSGK